MPDAITDSLTVADIDAHLAEWSHRYRIANSNSIRTMSRRALDNWLDLRNDLTRRCASP